MHPAPLGEIEALARDYGLAVVRAVGSDDVACRADACAGQTTAAVGVGGVRLGNPGLLASV